MNYLIAANWKMNGSKEFIESYLSAINIEDNPDVKMLICPPDCYLNDINTNAPVSYTHLTLPTTPYV